MSLTVLTGQDDHQLIALQICRELRMAAFTVCINLYRPLPTRECLVLSTQRAGVVYFTSLALLNLRLGLACRGTFPPPHNLPTGCYTFPDQCLRRGHIARPDGLTPVFLGHYFSTCGSHTSWQIPELHPHALNLDFSRKGQAFALAGPVRFITTAAINHSFLCVVSYQLRCDRVTV